MNPYTRAYVVIPGELSEEARGTLIQNIEMLYQGQQRGHASQDRYVIFTYGQWELEIETKLRTGVEYNGRLSIHCFSPKEPVPAAGSFVRRTHHWY